MEVFHVLEILTKQMEAMEEIFHQVLQDHTSKLQPEILLYLQ
jgi:hypothetical protein